mgnify:FL=1
MLNLNDFKSPKNESSLFKGIPISERQNPIVRELMKTRLFSVRYRVVSKPNYNRSQWNCIKEFADTFAIYPYSGYQEYYDLVQGLAESYTWPNYYDKEHDYCEELATIIIGKNGCLPNKYYE